MARRPKQETVDQDFFNNRLLRLGRNRWLVEVSNKSKVRTFLNYMKKKAESY